jgi:hypothetical protein
MIMRNIVPVLAAALALLSFSSNAATDCNGTVTRVLLYGDGTVNLLSSWRGDYTVLCNTNGTFGGIPSEVCLSWYGTLLNAASHGKQVNVYYGVTLTCATLPTYWSAPVPTYVGVIG